jgi:hypothetical protein
MSKTEIKSLGIFSMGSTVRQFCISMFIHPLFSRFMMLTVIINCGFMTLSKPPEFVEDILEHVFMTIYTLECIVKIVARGFFVDQLSYVRDPWNLVDLFVVGLGYIMQIIDLISPYIRMGKG